MDLPFVGHLKLKQTVTALIVGAGAVENAWAPVLKAIQPYYDIPLTADGANCVLARLVYLLRWYSADNSPIATKELAGLKDFLREIRHAICLELRKSQENGEIRVRPEFENIVRKLLLQERNQVTFMLVTTNWDTVVPTALFHIVDRTMKGSIRPLHIHGSVEDEATLYLPTEMTKEPYRSKAEEQRHGQNHGSVWRGLEGAHRAIVYGLSLSPLDAELGQTLATGWTNKNLEEINVVCPDHGQVAHRVNLLLDPRREVKVKGYQPNDVEQFVDYTVKRETSS